MPTMTNDPTLLGLVVAAAGLALLVCLLVIRALRARRSGDASEVDVEPAEVDATPVEVEAPVEEAPVEEAPGRGQRHTFWSFRRPRRTTSAGTSSEPAAPATTAYDVPGEPALADLVALDDLLTSDVLVE